MIGLIGGPKSRDYFFCGDSVPTVDPPNRQAQLGLGGHDQFRLGIEQDA